MVNLGLTLELGEMLATGGFFFAGWILGLLGRQMLVNFWQCRDAHHEPDFSIDECASGALPPHRNHYWLGGVCTKCKNAVVRLTGLTGRLDCTKAIKSMLLARKGK